MGTKYPILTGGQNGVFRSLDRSKVIEQSSFSKAPPVDSNIVSTCNGNQRTRHTVCFTRHAHTFTQIHLGCYVWFKLVIKTCGIYLYVSSLTFNSNIFKSYWFSFFFPFLAPKKICHLYLWSCFNLCLIICLTKTDSHTTQSLLKFNRLQRPQPEFKGVSRCWRIARCW